ncbi:MAG: carboxypeptidase-like regulatory domain-containing protein, partial [Cyclobacteriaceae bacterium]|nr:carboxypeptidase-like regulatory domain-containing protein [Cyclobacteriaceae bacterium]
MKTLIALLLITGSAWAQTTITGTVADTQGEALPGANVVIKDSYDGGSTDINGKFAFSTLEKGNHIVVVTVIG